MVVVETAEQPTAHPHPYNGDRELRFRIGPKTKIEEEHIHPNSRQKIRVIFAAQVLSASMATALNVGYENAASDESVLTTAGYVRMFDTLFYQI